MTKEQYIQGITNFGREQGDFSGKKIVEKYPYFLIGRLLSAVYEQSENETLLALMHPDRARLSAILHTKIKTAKKTEKKSKIEPITEKKKETEKEIPQKKPRKSKESKQKDPLSILQKRLREIEKDKNDIIENVVSEEIPPLPDPEPSVSLDELVEKFNKYPPTITTTEADFNEELSYRDLGENSSMEKTDVVSETLARIYVSQKLFDKAIKIYQELLLKYPEKNVIFASLIENLRKEIKQD